MDAIFITDFEFETLLNQDEVFPGYVSLYMCQIVPVLYGFIWIHDITSKMQYFAYMVSREVIHLLDLWLALCTS